MFCKQTEVALVLIMVFYKWIAVALVLIFMLTIAGFTMKWFFSSPDFYEP